ncbi:MAG: hypothetical protein JXB15_06780 [Anaerolineales bacterium]|nr:hypothetical protein [Anaerolineales bacterium]
MEVQFSGLGSRIIAKENAHCSGRVVRAIRALAYFADAEALPTPRMLDRIPWSKMRKFLERQAMETGRKHLADLWK